LKDVFVHLYLYFEPSFKKKKCVYLKQIQNMFNFSSTNIAVIFLKLVLRHTFITVSVE